jgi:cephalosporin hydroxylase
MEHFYDASHMGEDWFTYPVLYKNMVAQFPSGSRFVEIGSWKGKSAAYMAVEIINSGKDIKFDCVDIWTDVDEPHVQITGDDLFQTFLNNIEPVKQLINPIRSDSRKAAELFEDNSIDFIFFDGDHSYDGLKADLEAWLPKMKPNDSIFAGHDYAWTPHIQQLLNDMYGEDNYSDPWRTGSFMFKVVDGKLQKYTEQIQIKFPELEKNNQKPTTFHYKVGY